MKTKVLTAPELAAHWGHVTDVLHYNWHVHALQDHAAAVAAQRDELLQVLQEIGSLAYQFERRPETPQALLIRIAAFCNRVAK